ncbi:sterile alpha motif-like domain-containing protein [Staphylococcus gallinarum]|uniref:sterile alpha motif-like domain-containing protein n=1 Tax=Staphylococcus gallinarum TaxID=1293 RepID=UPI003F56FFFF
MSFYEFIQNYSGDDTPLGELANWIDQDANFPKDEESVEEILRYFRKQGLEDWIIEYVKRSLYIYSNYC